MQDPILTPFIRILPILAALSLTSSPAKAAQPLNATLQVDPSICLQTTDRHRLIGTNLSLWSRKHIIESPQFKNDIRDWRPASIRMPGGSWSNEYYWNGNGVRIGNNHSPENFDATQQNPDRTWKIDYRDYKKGFRVHGEERKLSDYHGDLDVKLQHEWINSLGSEAIVTVNVGSGSPKLATEWLKWANQKNNYGVRYWEIGNELNGDWELGHRLPDGSSMTGEIYTQRFLQFSKAMRAQDPTIKLGGPACSDLNLDFVETLIRQSGDALDFVTLHAYPVGVNTKTSSQKFAAIDQMRTAARKVHQWIEKYQPHRKDQIEIGISEWNIKVNEDRDTVELINGLWSALWIGAMFEAGIDFANQWDLSTYVKEGGHGAFYLDEAAGITIPKSQYWALWIWGKLMGNELVQSKIKGDRAIMQFVTRNEQGLQIMLINTSETADATLTIKAPGTTSAGQLHTFSSAEYFWNPQARKPLWSRPPTSQAVALPKITLPKFSINVLQLPWETSQTTQPTPAPKTATANQVTLDLLLPDRVAADRPIQGWLVAHDPKQALPYLQKMGPVKISVQGPAKLSSKKITLQNGSAPFQIQPTGPGSITIHAQAGDFSAQHQIELIALKQRAFVNWTFDNPIDQWQVRSTYDLGSESSIRPNQYVAAARLNNALPARDADLLFHFEPLPRKKLPFNNASGVIGKLRAAHNLKCADPKARINLILQSDANHWMPIGSVPLSAVLGQWKQFAFTVKDPQLLDAMGKLYALRFQIQANAPVTGDIYLDDLGFIFSTGLE
jgi:hypothetical protein